jgi:hypothetical protein
LKRCTKHGVSLRIHQKEAWNLLVNEIIKIFLEPLPDSEEEIVSTDEEVQELEEFKEEEVPVE